MKHSQEADNQLAGDILKRALSTPEVLRQEEDAKHAPLLVPSDINEYRWLLSWETLYTVLKYTLLCVALGAVVAGAMAAKNFMTEAQTRYEKHAGTCDVDFFKLFCLHRTLEKPPLSKDVADWR